ncbi:MAG: acyl-CoA dehydratase activase [bacterium]
MITAGIDIGSVSTETLILNEDKIIAYDIMPTGPSSKETAEQSLSAALSKAGLNQGQIQNSISTGYGRENVEIANKQVSEITCIGAGACFLFSDIGGILDIGGQDSKAIKLDSKGKMIDFAMNDKCAAGTGRFLEVMARVLGVNIESLGELSLSSTKKAVISNMCTVFAESEVVSLIHNGWVVEDIANGIHDSIAERAIGLLHKVKATGNILLTGGVMKNKGVVRAITRHLAAPPILPEEAQIVCALGAAVLAKRMG